MSFYLDVICKDRRFNSLAAVRDPALLAPGFRSKIQVVIADAATAGVMLRILETYRSGDLQQIYFLRGATKLRTVGVHHYGLACDLGIMIGGQVSWKANYGLVGKLAAKHGLVWGGDWGEPGQEHSFRDYDHLQGVSLGDQPKLFAGSWYPTDDYVPSEVG